MGKTYSEQEIDTKLQNIKNFSRLYNSRLVNYTGIILRTQVPYVEYISEKLLDFGFIEKIKQIKEIKRNKPYPLHKGKVTKTNRNEENFAKTLNHQTFLSLGEIIDYQIPLKGRQVDKAGGIDLISNKDNFVYIIELKYESKETLLRAVLEIATYYQQLDKNNFLKGFKFTNKRIKKAVLILEGTTPHKQFMELKNTPNLKTLIKELDISIFVIQKNPLITKEL